MESHRDHESTVSGGEKQTSCSACSIVPTWARDLVMWRSVPKTAAVVVIGFVLLFLLMEFSLLSVVAYVGLATLASSIIAKLSIKIKPQFAESCPYIWYVVGGSESNRYEVTREQAERFVDVALPHLNAMLAHMHDTVSLNNPMDAVKHAILLWLLTFIGAWFNLLTLIAIGFGLAFSVPRVYEQFQPQFDDLGVVIKAHAGNLLQHVDGYINLLKQKVGELFGKQKAQ